MKEVFQAIHSAEIEDFMARLGVLQESQAGKLKCCACGDPITQANFRLVTRRNGRLLFACTKETCLAAPLGGGST